MVRVPSHRAPTHPGEMWLEELRSVDHGSPLAPARPAGLFNTFAMNCSTNRLMRSFASGESGRLSK